jgi:type 1 fimbriae regulatory protein FimB/type 1 fimbriae regulatory protein FimE
MYASKLIILLQVRGEKLMTRKKPLKPPPTPSALAKKLHLEEEQVHELRRAASKLGRNGHRDQTMILLAFHHGLRVSELTGLTWDQVHLDRKKPEIYIIRCKGSKSGMHVLFPDDVTALKKLAAEKERTGYVFKSEAIENPGPVSDSGFFRIVKRAGKEAKLGLVHPHMLRHSCGYWLRKERYDLLDIADWLGHRNLQNTQRYAAAGADHWREIGIGTKAGRIRERERRK